ncbi:MAG: caspase family protein [Polyangia bacterium]
MNRHALLIGIQNYPFLRHVDASGHVLESHDLRGCVNDVRLIQQLLVERFGFARSSVTLLLNEAATRAAILRELDALVERTAPDDVVVLFYAGHGSQMADREGTKLDPKLDDTLIPFDSGRGAHPNRDITDDELRLWLIRLANKTRFITLLFDCCHSATMHRSAGPVLSGERGLPADPRALSELPASPIDPKLLPLLGSQAEWLPASDHYVYIGACLAKEKAREVAVFDGGETIHHGALTYELAQALLSAPAGSTYQDVFERAACAVTRAIPTQHPQIEGARQRVLFDMSDREIAPYVLVESVTAERTVWLSGGKPRGVVVSSEWVLFPPGTQHLELTEEASARPRVRVISSDATRAQAHLIHDAGPVEPLWRAVLAEQPLDTKWSVAVYDHTGAGGAVVQLQAVPQQKGSRDELQDLLSGIQSSPWLRLVAGKETPRLSVHLVPARQDIRAGDIAPQLGALDHTCFLIVDDGGEIWGAPLRRVQTQGVLKNLERLVRRHFVRTLCNPRSALRGQLDLAIYLLPGSGDPTALHKAPTELPIVTDGAQLALEITNRSRLEVYVSVLEIDQAAGIRQVYPPRGASAPLAAHGSGRIGLGEGRPIRVRFPRELPVRADGQRPTEAQLEYLLVVTLQPMDLEPLLQERVRGESQGFTGSSSVLGQILATAFFGGPAGRSVRMSMPPDCDWVTELRSLRVQAAAARTTAGSG